MSDRVAAGEGVVIEPAGEDDIARTLQELRRKNETLEREAAAERSRRISLETNLEGERAARATAETERDTATARVVTEAESRWIAERSAAAAAVTAREQALEAAQEDYARHAEMGEWGAAAKAQVAISTTAAELLELRRKQEYLDANKERLVPKPSPARTEQGRAPSEPAIGHRYARLINGPLVGGEEAWLDARPNFQTDERYRQKVFSASAIAAQEHERGSDAYLREVERILGEGGRAQEPTYRNETEKRHEPAARAPSPDLPPSRRPGPGQAPAGSQEEIRLSPDEVEVADGLYGDPNTDWYIANGAERYRHYHQMKLRKSGRG